MPGDFFARIWSGSAVFGGFRVAAEQERDAPECCKADEAVDDAAHDACLPTKQEGDTVEPKQADAAPVQAADDGEDQCNSIEHKNSPFRFAHSMAGRGIFMHSCGEHGKMGVLSAG